MKVSSLSVLHRIEKEYSIEREWKQITLRIWHLQKRKYKKWKFKTNELSIPLRISLKKTPLKTAKVIQHKETKQTILYHQNYFNKGLILEDLRVMLHPRTHHITANMSLLHKILPSFPKTTSRINNNSILVNNTHFSHSSSKVLFHISQDTGQCKQR